MGSAQVQSKQFRDAAESLNQAKQLQPHHPQIRIKLIEACLHGALFEQAYKELAEIESNFPQLLAKDWFRVGVLQHQLNLEHKALKSFTCAAELEPTNTEFIYNLALAQKNCGQLEDAQQNLNSVLKKHPTYLDAWHALTLLKKATPDENAITELQALLPHSAAQQQIKLLFSVAKSYEDIGEFDEAFVHMQQANETRKQRLGYQVDNDIQLMQELKQVYCDFDSKSSSVESERPLFIVGLPRSGSTLVERLLTQPDEVASAGELLHFSAILSQLTQEEFGASTSRAEFVRNTARVSPEQLGNNYLAATHSLAGKQKFLVDKMPLNFLNVGAIMRALPGAKIIHIKRRPIDNVLAIYKTLFEQAYPYAYDLRDIARYLVAERELMAHWQSLYTKQIFSCQYEEFVSEPEQSTRSLYEFCNLEFKSEYLDIANNKSAAATASASQVRKSIYSSSVDNWRNYAQHLQPVIDLLQKNHLF